MAEVAARLGKPFMPHQRHIADVALEINPQTGLPAYDTIIVIGPRQVTGKTELLLPLMTHRCVGFTDKLAQWVHEELGIWVPKPGPQTVLYTAQTADEARKKWRDVHLARLKASAYYRPKKRFLARLQRNLEAIMWDTGSIWSPASTTGKTGGTGDSVDLGVIDEAWSRPDWRTELGMRPAMMTRPWRQLWIASMIPGLERVKPDEWTYLRERRRAARELVAAGVNYGTALFDFTAPEGLDPGDPETWYTCMPGLGRTVRESTVAADFPSRPGSGLPLVDFCAEYLGWEPKETVPMWTLVPEKVWTGLRDPASEPAGMVAISAEMNEDRSRGYIGVAGRRADGHWHVEQIEPGQQIAIGTEGVDWMDWRVPEVLGRWGAPLVVDPRRPSASLIASMRALGFEVLTPNTQEIQAACGRFYDRTGARAGERDDGTRLRHLDQQSVNRAVAIASKIDVGAGAFTFVRRGTTEEICPLYLVVLAMLGVELADPPTPPLPEPEIFY